MVAYKKLDFLKVQNFFVRAVNQNYLTTQKIAIARFRLDRQVPFFKELLFAHCSSVKTLLSLLFSFKVKFGQVKVARTPLRYGIFSWKPCFVLFLFVMI